MDDQFQRSRDEFAMGDAEGAGVLREMGDLQHKAVEDPTYICPHRDFPQEHHDRRRYTQQEYQRHNGRCPECLHVELIRE